MNAMLGLLLGAATVFQVDPWSNRVFLPDADPAGGVKVGERVTFAAARGEYEALSVVVVPDRDYAKVDVKVGTLKWSRGTTPSHPEKTASVRQQGETASVRQQGETASVRQQVGGRQEKTASVRQQDLGSGEIEAGACDVASVKVWFRPDGRWLHSWAGNQTKPTPINNLVLHDDGLVKVDWEKKINYVRGDYEDGSVYMDMSHRELETHLNNDTEPIRDAAAFVPFDLKAGFRQQYLLTWHVPKDAKAGTYRGTVGFVAGDGATVASFAVELEVYPFSLPSARTHYDTTQRYYSFWMGSPTLSGLLREGCRLDRAERKLRNIYRNMVAHNAGDLSDLGGMLEEDDADSLPLRTLLIARQEGMRADPLINGYAWDIGARFVSTPGDPKGPAKPEEEPEAYTNSLKRYAKAVETQMAIMKKYLGHSRCYYSNPDECGPGTYRRAYGYWRIVHERGGYIWNDYAYPEHSGWTTDVNDIPATFSHVTAWEWHRGGAKCFTYAGTFTGPECPDLWRRNKGLRYWYSDYDGQHEYCFFDGRANRWNDFVRYDRYCQFGIVYWTIDGLVSTLAWEANREGLDDVRYFSLLRLRAEAAMASKDAATRKLGREALVWQDGIDPEYWPDLNALRRETAKWIVRLMAVVGEEPAEQATELPPIATLPAERGMASVPKKGTDTKALLAFAEKHGGKGTSMLSLGDHRLDMALAALENVYGDARLDFSTRANAAMRAAVLHSLLSERRAALKAIDTVLNTPHLPNAERTKLRLARTKALLTDARFEERYTRKQLDDAAESAGEALKGTGATARMRSEMVCQLVRGYLSAGEYDRCVEYAGERIKDTALDTQGLTDAHFYVARAHMYKEDWAKALKAFDEVHRAYNNDKDKNFRAMILPFEAIAAENGKDYVRAVHCLTELIPTYDPEEGKTQIKMAKKKIQQLQPLVRKNTTISMGELDDDDTKDDISLED